jgi:RNA binding exosome subunit
MKRLIVLILAACLLCAATANADLLDKARTYLDKDKGGGGIDTNTVVAGLKEALSVGAKNGTAKVSKVDGYLGNPFIRIPVPENVQKIEKTLRKVGLDKEVDKFIVSMNRAAEKAGPQALSFFVDAVKQMTIPDAMNILRGNDTAATDFLKSKTYKRIYDVFKPVVTNAMNDVGVTRAFKELMDKARTIPLLKQEAVDLDHYVTSKALDGLFVVVGQEEKKIRKDPKARVTELLRTVFK